MRSRLLALALGLTLAGCNAVSVPEPKFTTVLKDGPFEIRDYPSMTVAEVAVTGSQWGAANKGFRLLADYIFRGNAHNESIPMTAPVVQERTGATAQQEDWLVRFFMPEGATLQTLPAPNDTQVRLATLPPTRDAVMQFSGWALSGSVKERTRQLRVWMGTRHLEPAGPPALAQYNPPWTIWFLRRNEVMIPLALPPAPPPS